MSLHSSLPAATYSLAGFTVVWDAERQHLSLWKGQHCLWDSLPGKAFLAAARGQSDVRESRGFFTLDDRRTPFTTTQHLGVI